jgi:MerR family redox-sensitive transcriptional activator SoxR
MGDLLPIPEISRRRGVASSALRFYAEKGLIKSERSGRGHRRYPRAVLRRVAFIVFAQKIGLSLEEIGKELSKLPGHHVPERSDWAKPSGNWTKRINERIAELERLRAGLTQCIGCGCLWLDQLCTLQSWRPGRQMWLWPSILDCKTEALGAARSTAGSRIQPGSRFGLEVRMTSNTHYGL